MLKNVSITLGLVWALGCSSNEPAQPIDSRVSQATSAIQALSERDEATVAQCTNAVEACNLRRPDAAPADLCERLSSRCDDVNARLAEVRDPAVGCWRAVQECAEHTPEQAQCSRDPADCESVEAEAKVERDKAAECSARVEECLARVTELPEAAAVSCENVAAACDRVAAQASQGQDNNGDDQGDDGDDQGDDGDDQGDDDPGEEDDEDGDNGGRPDAGRDPVRPTPPDRGNPNKGDAGVENDD